MPSPFDEENVLYRHTKAVADNPQEESSTARWSSPIPHANVRLDVPQHILSCPTIQEATPSLPIIDDFRDPESTIIKTPPRRRTFVEIVAHYDKTFGIINARKTALKNEMASKEADFATLRAEMEDLLQQARGNVIAPHWLEHDVEVPSEHSTEPPNEHDVEVLSEHFESGGYEEASHAEYTLEVEDLRGKAKANATETKRLEREIEVGKRDMMEVKERLEEEQRAFYAEMEGVSVKEMQIEEDKKPNWKEKLKQQGKGKEKETETKMDQCWCT